MCELECADRGHRSRLRLRIALAADHRARLPLRAGKGRDMRLDAIGQGRFRGHPDNRRRHRRARRRERRQGRGARRETSSWSRRPTSPTAVRRTRAPATSTTWLPATTTRSGSSTTSRRSAYTSRTRICCAPTPKRTCPNLDRFDSWGGGICRSADGQIISLKWLPYLPSSMAAADIDMMNPLYRRAKKLGVRFINKVAMIDLLKDGDKVVGGDRLQCRRRDLPCRSRPRRP